MPKKEQYLKLEMLIHRPVEMGTLVSTYITLLDKGQSTTSMGSGYRGALYRNPRKDVNHIISMYS